MLNSSMIIIWLIAALASTVADAETVCFNGGNATGRLSFDGAVEGTGFEGRFGDFDAEYCIDDGRPVDGRIVVEVALGSADTDNDDRDQTLMGPEFFAVADHPVARWQSAGIAADDGGYRADGELTLKGITRSQGIRFTLAPAGEDLIVRGEFTLSGSAELDRQRWNVGTGDFADPEFVRDRVDVSFEVRLSKQPAES